MSQTVKESFRQCEVVASALKRDDLSREDLWELRAVLRAAATNLEWVVRDWQADEPQSVHAARARGSLQGMQSGLSWIEVNRFGLLRHEITRDLTAVIGHAEALFGSLAERSGGHSRSRWDGVERRKAERRAHGDRRTRERSPADRRIRDRRVEARTRSRTRPMAEASKP